MFLFAQKFHWKIGFMVSPWCFKYYLRSVIQNENVLLKTTFTVQNCAQHKYICNFCVYKIFCPFMHVMFTIVNKRASSWKLERHGCISQSNHKLCDYKSFIWWQNVHFYVSNPLRTVCGLRGKIFVLESSVDFSAVNNSNEHWKHLMLIDSCLRQVKRVMDKSSY